MEAPPLHAQLAHELEICMHGSESGLQWICLPGPRPVLGGRAKRVSSITSKAVPVGNTEPEPEKVAQKYKKKRELMTQPLRAECCQYDTKMWPVIQKCSQRLCAPLRLGSWGAQLLSRPAGFVSPVFHFLAQDLLISIVVSE